MTETLNPPALKFVCEASFQVENLIEMLRGQKASTGWLPTISIRFST